MQADEQDVLYESTVSKMERVQTALEWLEYNLIGNPHFEEDFRHNRKIFEQTKQMEKEQIINALYNSMEFDPNVEAAENIIIKHTVNNATRLPNRD